MHRQIIAVCSQIHTKHINTLCWQNVELWNVKLSVHVLTTLWYIRVRPYDEIQSDQKPIGLQSHNSVCSPLTLLFAQDSFTDI